MSSTGKQRDPIGSAPDANKFGIEHRRSPEVVAEAVVGLNQILPVQFFDRSGGPRLSAEQRLMLAMLGDAVRVYRQGVLSRAARKRMLYVDAERWIMESERNPFAFGFDTVCEALGLDAAAVRKRLIAWKQMARRELAAPYTPEMRLKYTAREKAITNPRNRRRDLGKP